MSVKFLSKLSMFAGLLLAVFGLWLAYGLGYNHFYEFLLAGLLLFLAPLTKDLINKNVLLKLYGIFFVAGLMGDLLMGIFIFDLWHYTYSNLIEYALIYLWIYPVAGIVMVQTYFLLVSKLKPGADLEFKNINPLGLRPMIILSVTLALICSAIFVNESNGVALRQVGFLLVSVVAFIILSWYSYGKYKVSLVGQVASNPVIVASSLVLATFLNALVHELPNVEAQQWIYHGDGVVVAGVLLNVLLMWPLLLILPLAVAFSVIFAKKRPKS